jgi:hypothetical protein
VKDARRELIESGFCRVPDVLTPTILGHLRAATDALCATQTEEHAARFRAQGSMFALGGVEDPVFARLIAWRPALDALAAMGFPDPTYTDGYVISKPPRSPRLFWHYDWFAWDDPTAYAPVPQQVFLMYYLSDTAPENGCLRVLPGSHISHNPVHDLLAEPHSRDLSAGDDGSRAEFSTRPDEVDAPVSAGDVVIGDARLLHATHANDSDQRRTVITLWYQPDFASLPERIKAQMVAKTHEIPDAWPAESREMVRRLNPVYEGDAEPYGRCLYRRQRLPG